MITKTIKEKFSELEENIAFRQERLIQYSENKLKAKQNNDQQEPHQDTVF